MRGSSSSRGTTRARPSSFVAFRKRIPKDRFPLQSRTISLARQAPQFDEAGIAGRAAAMFLQILEIAPNLPCAQQPLEECVQAIREWRSLLSLWRS
jgi:lipopolysaccharide biosynthesis regulator YciM